MSSEYVIQRRRNSPMILEDLLLFMLNSNLLALITEIQKPTIIILLVPESIPDFFQDVVDYDQIKMNQRHF